LHIQNLCGFSTPTANGQLFIMTLYKTERVATNKNFGIGGLPAEYLKIKMFLKNALNLKAKQNMYVYSIL
jgi:hypothetical protein